ncbi:MAG: sugar ABC transporter permease [Lachnospiraceae bacterium]|nr:sugar ABC transporter permease [Lachnospiraceae bacterium]
MGNTVKKKKKRRPYLWFMLPGLIFYCMFMIIPLIATSFLSLSSWDGLGELTFTGIENYKRLFLDPANAATYWNAFGNNMKFILCEYFIIVPIQVGVAYMLYSKIRWYKFFQAIFFLPYVLSTAVIAFFGTIFFNASFGIVNKALLTLGGSRVNLPGWLADQKMMFPILIGIGIWSSATIGMLIILSNMKNVSYETIESSTIDGAGSFQRFLYIILPDIGPGMINVLVLDIIWGITLFDLPYMLAGTFGGMDGRLDFVNMYFYRIAFGSGSMSRLNIDLGYAATIGTVTFLFILLFTSVMNFALGKVKVWNE